ncbi:MAG: flagellar hook-length control protein FliK [Geobacteraceae bacterium]|nr:flagellar hook-length control protein FliK [Geobacteraceae bacterium]NTW78980.1 flagellar hook-length control protein FliK [Geobacteraceae bacterium]
MALTADIQQQVFDLLSRASNISFVTADEGVGGVSQLAPGQRVSAEVLSTMANNRVQVRVGNERFNLDLPMAVRTGQTLEMTFVSADPRSTFAIARQAGAAPPVSLSDASRLLSLLVSNEQIVDQKFRSSLSSIGDMLRRSSGETGVLANLMDEALTYGLLREGSKAAPQTPGDLMRDQGGRQGAPLQQYTPKMILEQARLATFETNAAQILRTIAQNSRFILVEATNQQVVPLPLIPGEEVEAVVVGTLPGGRVFLQVAGTPVEMVLPRPVQNGDILRLTYISSQPKPTFALPRIMPDITSGVLSEAGRWLSVLEHSEGGVSSQQMYVLDRLNTVLKSLPHDSPAFTAIQDEAITYQTVMRGQHSPEQSAALQASLLSANQNAGAAGNGIVLSDDMAKLLQAVIKGNRLALLEALNQQAMPTGFAPGQQLKGEVLAALGGGRFMVMVAGQNLEFMLPKGVSRGDFINLFFITNEPRQTFLMARFGRSRDSRLSDTGRWLSSFLGEASAQLPAQATMGILRTLLAGPTTDASLLSRMLQQGLRESGLFYESHLASWFGGDYPLEEILKEPQGRLSPRLPQSMEQSGVPADLLARAGIRTGSNEIMEALFKKAGTSMAHEGIADQRALPIISEQLSALQSGQLLFRGDLFPGQRLEWTVAERDAGRNLSGGRERSWETSVTINLPNLGMVTALLTLDGTRVAIKINTENSSTVPILEEGRARLTEQLEGAGLDPTKLSISYEAS